MTQEQLRNLLPETMPEGLMEPEPVSAIHPLVWIGALTGLILATLGWLLAKRVFVKNDSHSTAPPAHKELLESLQRVERADDSMDVGTRARALSLAIRRYIDRVWDTDLGCRTSEETISLLQRGQVPIRQEIASPVIHFLMDCDRVAFGGESDPRAMNTLWEQVKNLVRPLTSLGKQNEQPKR